MKQRTNSLFALRTIRLLASSILAAMFLLIVPIAILAQQVSTTIATNPRVISYQGAITTNSGSPVTGDHLITTTLYSDANGTLAVWSGTYKQSVTGGVFSVLLGSGAYPLPDSQDFSKPLWIGVKIDGGGELKPLTQLTGSPFSLSIPDNSVTQNKMAADYVGSISVNGKQITGKGTTLNFSDGPGTSLLYDETTNSLLFSSSVNGNASGGKGDLPQGCQPDWLLAGNTFLAGCNNIFGFISTTPASDIFMVNNNTTQMTMLGATAPGNGLMFPTSTATGVGVIYQQQATINTYIHSFGGPTNFFAGNLAGNLTMTFITTCDGVATNTQNTGVGYQALSSLNGTGCDPDGDELLAEGSENTALGCQALQSNTTGWENTATGYVALSKNLTGLKNTADGACALQNNTGSYNTASGWGRSKPTQLELVMSHTASMRCGLTQSEAVMLPAVPLRSKPTRQDRLIPPWATLRSFITLPDIIIPPAAARRSFITRREVVILPAATKRYTTTPQVAIPPVATRRCIATQPGNGMLLTAIKRSIATRLENKIQQVALVR